MTPGPREHRSASVQVAIATALPDEMHDQTRELVSLRSTNPRKGHATALMHEVCAEADREWITLIVQPRKFDDGMDDEKLPGWYERFGFVVIQLNPMLMARSPQLPAIVRVH